ncbi:MAG: hypothetical protein AAF989_08075, partial [Planctomycetota bacterium]
MPLSAAATEIIGEILLADPIPGRHRLASDSTASDSTALGWTISSRGRDSDASRVWATMQNPLMALGPQGSTRPL